MQLQVPNNLIDIDKLYINLTSAINNNSSRLYYEIEFCNYDNKDLFNILYSKIIRFRGGQNISL